MVIVPSAGHSVEVKSRPYLEMRKDRCVEVNVVSKNTNHKNKRKTKEMKEFETKRRKVLGE